MFTSLALSVLIEVPASSFKLLVESDQFKWDETTIIEAYKTQSSARLIPRSCIQYLFHVASRCNKVTTDTPHKPQLLDLLATTVGKVLACVTDDETAASNSDFKDLVTLMRADMTNGFFGRIMQSMENNLNRLDNLFNIFLTVYLEAASCNLLASLCESAYMCQRLMEHVQFIPNEQTDNFVRDSILTSHLLCTNDMKLIAPVIMQRVHGKCNTLRILFTRLKQLNVGRFSEWVFALSNSKSLRGISAACDPYILVALTDIVQALVTAWDFPIEHMQLYSLSSFDTQYRFKHTASIDVTLQRHQEQLLFGVIHQLLFIVKSRYLDLPNIDIIPEVKNQLIVRHKDATSLDQLRVFWTYTCQILATAIQRHDPGISVIPPSIIISLVDFLRCDDICWCAESVKWVLQAVSALLTHTDMRCHRSVCQVLLISCLELICRDNVQELVRVLHNNIKQQILTDALVAICQARTKIDGCQMISLLQILRCPLIINDDDNQMNIDEVSASALCSTLCMLINQCAQETRIVNAAYDELAKILKNIQSFVQHRMKASSIAQSLDLQKNNSLVISLMETLQLMFGRGNNDYNRMIKIALKSIGTSFRCKSVLQVYDKTICLINNNSF